EPVETTASVGRACRDHGRAMAARRSPKTSDPLVDKGFRGPMTVGGRCLSCPMTTTASDPATGPARVSPRVKDVVLDRASAALAARREADVALLVAAAVGRAPPGLLARQCRGLG